LRIAIGFSNCAFIFTCLYAKCESITRKIKASNRPKFCLKLSLVSHGYNNTDVN